MRWEPILQCTRGQSATASGGDRFRRGPQKALVGGFSAKKFARNSLQAEHSGNSFDLERNLVLEAACHFSPRNFVCHPVHIFPQCAPSEQERRRNPECRSETDSTRCRRCRPRESWHFEVCRVPTVSRCSDSHLRTTQRQCSHATTFRWWTRRRLFPAQDGRETGRHRSCCWYGTGNSFAANARFSAANVHFWKHEHSL